MLMSNKTLKKMLFGAALCGNIRVCTATTPLLATSREQDTQRTQRTFNEEGTLALNNGDVPTCVICYDDKWPHGAVCHGNGKGWHFSHGQCWYQWVSQRKKCPACNQDFSPDLKDPHYLFRLCCKTQENQGQYPPRISAVEKAGLLTELPTDPLSKVLQVVFMFISLIVFQGLKFIGLDQIATPGVLTPILNVVYAFLLFFSHIVEADYIRRTLELRDSIRANLGGQPNVVDRFLKTNMNLLYVRSLVTLVLSFVFIFAPDQTTSWILKLFLLGDVPAQLVGGWAHRFVLRRKFQRNLFLPFYSLQEKWANRKAGSVKSMFDKEIEEMTSEVEQAQEQGEIAGPQNV